MGGICFLSTFILFNVMDARNTISLGSLGSSVILDLKPFSVAEELTGPQNVSFVSYGPRSNMVCLKDVHYRAEEE